MLTPRHRLGPPLGHNSLILFSLFRHDGSGGFQKRIPFCLRFHLLLLGHCGNERREYSRLMLEDEDATIAAWQAVRRDVIDPIIAE